MTKRKQGRPSKKPKEMQSHVVPLRLSEADLVRVKEAASRSHVPVAVFVRIAVLDRVSQEGKAVQ